MSSSVFVKDDFKVTAQPKSHIHAQGRPEREGIDTTAVDTPANHRRQPQSGTRAIES